MKKPLKFPILENSVFFVLWLIVFCIPLLQHGLSETILWKKIYQDWILTACYLFAFVLNFYLLIPALLAKSKLWLYLLAVLVLSLFSAGLGFTIINTVNWNWGQGMPPMELGPGLPPMELSKNMPPPVGYNIAVSNSTTAPLLHYLGILVITLLVTGTGTAYKVVLMWIRERRLMKQLQENQASDPAPEQKYIFVKANLKNVRIELDTIRYIESANEYIRIHLETGDVITTFMRLKHMETELSARKFMRVHRSFIINLEKIKAVEKHRLLIGNNSYIPIGGQFKESIDNYLRNKSLPPNPA